MGKTNYKAMAGEALKNGTAVVLTTDMVIWEEVGQTVIGRLLEKCDFSEGQYETVVQKYTIETDEGLVTTVLGQQGDKVLNKDELVGKIIHITFRGKKKTKKENTMNDFFIQMIPDGDKRHRK